MKQIFDSQRNQWQNRTNHSRAEVEADIMIWKDN